MKKRILWRRITVVILAAFLAGCGPKSPVDDLLAPVVSAIQPGPNPNAALQAPPVALTPAAVLPTLPEGENATFRIALPDTVDTFDPLLTQNAINILPYMVETLTRLSPTGEVLPLLAFGWQISEDGLTYTIDLQQGVFFSDGAPFNAQAVQYNLERFQALQPPMVSRTAIENISEIEMVDEHQVKLHLSSPANDLLMALSDIRLAMLSPGSLPISGKFYDNIELNTPVGTGPYLLAEFVPGDHLNLQRNTSYWSSPPYHDIVNFQFVPDAETRKNMLLNGQTNLTLGLPLADLKTLAEMPGLVVQHGEPYRQVFMGINTARPNLDNQQTRQALNYAIDQQGLVSNVLLGAARPSTSPMPDDFLGACQASLPYTQDVAQSISLLNAAGVPEDRALKIILPAGRIPQGEQVAEAVAEYLRGVEFPVTVEALEWDAYLAALSAPPAESDYDLYLFQWPGSIPHSNYTLQLLKSGSPLNASHYSNPQVDEWLRSAESSLDEGDVEDLYCNLSQVIWQDAPWIFLYQQDDPIVYAANFANIEVLPGQRFRAIFSEPMQ
jgi:peptide/nickel transport system substrate-binding protein